MSFLPKSKFGNCTQCPATNVNCVKVGKNLVCIPCHRGNKNTIQIQKANQRDRERAEAVKGIKPKEKRKLKSSIKTSVRGLGGETNNRNLLLKTADNTFTDWLKRRDADVNGYVKCPCCGQRFHLDAVDEQGKKIVQPLHYVSRSVYSLRFDPDNVFCGCSFDNLQMHLQPEGQAKQNYRKFLVSKLGETAAVEMESQKRKLHKLDNNQLKNIIEHYSQN